MTTATVTILVINYILIGAVSLVALWLMGYWNWLSGGSWRKLGAWRFHPSGRALMGLLAIIFFITLNAAVQGLVPLPLHVKAPFYFALYGAFIVALVRIGLTIRSEANNRPQTGKVDISDERQE